MHAALLIALGVATATPLPRVPSAALASAHFAFAPDPYSDPARPSELLLVRSRDGALRVWFIPVREGLRRLPADERWTPGPPCRHFSVDFARGVIGCGDSALEPARRARYRWSLDGRRLTDFVPDLIPVPGLEREGAFVIHAGR